MPPRLSAAPPAPSRALDTPEQFSAKSDAFVAWMASVPGEWNSFEDGRDAFALTQAWRAAAGAGGKLLATAAGPKVWFGNPTDRLVESLTPLVGPAGQVFGQNGSTWDGTGSPVAEALRPVETDAGIRFHRQTGFQMQHGIISQASAGWCLDMIVDMPPVAATYATKAAADAALSSHPVGAIVYVTGAAPFLTGLGAGWEDAPADALRGMGLLSVYLRDCGYYIRGNGTWGKLSAQIAKFWKTGGGSETVELYLGPLGMIEAYAYDGTRQALLPGFYDDRLAQGGRFHVRIERDDEGGYIVSLNGEEKIAAHTTIDFVPDRFALNGAGRSGSGTSALPVDGASFTLVALSITEGLDYPGRRAVSDVLARACGTPDVHWSPVADIVVHIDQSRTAEANQTTAGDPNRPDAISNWSGEIAGRAANDPVAFNPTQRQLPGVYCFRNIYYPDPIGPFCAAGGGYGVASSNNNRFTLSGSATETIEMGLAAQLRLHQTGGAFGRGNHLYFAGHTAGGQPLTFFQIKSGKYIRALPSLTVTEWNYASRDFCNRQVQLIVERCRRRGQLTRIVCLSNLQSEIDIGSSTAAHEADMRQWWDDELRQLVDLPTTPLFLLKTPSYSSGGTGNDCNTAGANYGDDQYRRLGANKDTGHPIRILGSIYAWCGRFIHWPQVKVRLLGEAMGDLIGRFVYKAEFEDTPQVVSAVRSGSNVVLTVNRPVDIVASTAAPTVLATLTTGGYNTYGLVYEPTGGGRTFSGHVTLSGDGLTITAPISGGGPVAGDRISVTGAGARWSNFRARSRRYGVFTDHNWGSLPLATATPTINLTGGATNEITEWLAPSSHVLT